MQDDASSNNPLYNNAMAFWVALVLMILGLVATLFYLFVRTTQESLIMPGPQLRVKHLIVSLLVLVAGAVLASFSRPRTGPISQANRYNR
jgi:hypothetical protein